MTEKKGHFEKGKWVEDSEPVVMETVAAEGTGATGATDGSVTGKKFSEATTSVKSSVDNVMKVTRDLVTTEEGKQHTEKTIKDTQAQLHKSLDTIMNRVKEEVDKKVKKVK